MVLNNLNGGEENRVEVKVETKIFVVIFGYFLIFE